MATTITDYANVQERAQELGLRTPAPISLLPKNFVAAASREDLYYPPETLAVSQLLRESGIEESRLLPDDEQRVELKESAFTGWEGPILYIAASASSATPYTIDFLISVIANYATDLLKGLPQSKRRARLSVVVDGTGCRRIDYDGPVEGIKGLGNEIRGMLPNE